MDAKIGECALTRDMGHRDAGIATISSSLLLIPENFKELAYILTATDIPKEVQLEDHTGGPKAEYMCATKDRMKGKSIKESKR